MFSTYLMNAFILAQDLLIALAASAMLVMDLWKKTIPDWVTYPAMAAGWVLHGWGFGMGGIWDPGFLGSILGGALGAMVFGPFWWAGKRMDSGDVKAAIAVGSLTGFLDGLTCFLCITLAGAVLALVILFIKRRSRSPESPMAVFSYGSAIFIGVCWSLLIRHGVFPLFP